jgi:hypothetical protein
MRAHIMLIATAIAAFAGCERVVDITVPSQPTRLVVDARLERVLGRVSGRQQITLTTSQEVFATTAPPPATGATVRVSDSAGRVVTFTPVSGQPGVYGSDSLVIATGQRYTLDIAWSGAEYRATTRAVGAPSIDSIYFTLASAVGPIDGGDGLRAAVTFRDVGGRPDFFLFDQVVNGRRIVSPDSTFPYRVILPDAVTGDGRAFQGFQPYQTTQVAPGDTVTLRVMGLPEDAYRWYTTINAQSGSAGGPFGIPPASARGNIQNRTRPAELVFGYFYATEVSEATRRVP